jgi:hypothetical protein
MRDNERKRLQQKQQEKIAVLYCSSGERQQDFGIASGTAAGEKGSRSLASPVVLQQRRQAAGAWHRQRYCSSGERLLV